MLIAQVDALDSNADAVSLMTLHNAKGLEYPIVFVTGLEDGLFPGMNSIENEDKLEEERRLFYVGITRAERKLYLSFAESRRRNGQVTQSIRSRFLHDIPPALMEEKRTLKLRSTGRMSFSRDARSQESAFGPAAWRGGPTRTTHEVPAWRGSKPSAAPAEDAGPAYVTGERISHKLFGGGRIEELSGTGRDVKAVIAFDDVNVGRKTIKLAYTTLERGQG
jgi:DNA helicase-2/ATP-dependent DNA helicase PcrA